MDVRQPDMLVSLNILRTKSACKNFVNAPMPAVVSAACAYERIH
jgi:hypothetical protein